jgi:hypothetical protein
MPLIVVSAGTQNSETVKERSCPPNASHKTINDCPQLIGLYEGQADCCPNCRTPFEIVSVKFKFGGVAMIASCPNCAIAADWSVVEWKTLSELKTSALVVLSSWAEWLALLTRSVSALGISSRY